MSANKPAQHAKGVRSLWFHLTREERMLTLLIVALLLTGLTARYVHHRTTRAAADEPSLLQSQPQSSSVYK